MGILLEYFFKSKWYDINWIEKLKGGHKCHHEFLLKISFVLKCLKKVNNFEDYFFMFSSKKQGNKYVKNILLAPKTWIIVIRKWWCRIMVMMLNKKDLDPFFWGLWKNNIRGNFSLLKMDVLSLYNLFYFLFF